MTPGKVMIAMPAEYSNTDPRVWAKLREGAGYDENAVTEDPCPFKEGDIIDCRGSEGWHSQSADVPLPAAAVVTTVDSDGTVEISHFDSEGEAEFGDYIQWKGCTLLHRLGTPIEAVPAPDTRTNGGPAATYDYTHNPDWNPG